MGFFDKIKKVFDKGGVGIDIDCPESFRWSDQVFPIAVRLSNDSDDERVVTQLSMSLGEDTLHMDHDDEDSPSERARRKRRMETSATTFEHREPITLAPGEIRTLEIEFPLTLSGAAEVAGAGDDAPGWLGVASDALGLLDEVRSKEPWYRLKVRPQVEGFSAAEVESRRVRNVRFGEFYKGVWRHRFG